MGMPVAMIDQFFGWDQALLRGETVEERVAAGRQVLAYLEQHLAEERKRPSTPLTEAIVTAELDGRPLNDGEILGMFMTFYLGGLDTVYSTLSWSMRHIATHPEYQAFIRDNPDMLNKVVDEYLRMFSVVSTQRRVARDHTFHGVEMKQDDLVVMPIFVACRDPEFYPNPHEAEFGRKSRLLAFASGPHLCLGMHLARRELRIAIETFLARFKEIQIPKGQSYEYHAGPTLTMTHLPITWEKQE
jgi:cytochrome P450